MALSVEEVRGALEGGDEAIRQAAVARLDLTERGAVALLVAAMADASWRVRREAVTRATVGELDAGVLVAALVPVLAEPSDIGLRNAAIDAVVAIGRPALASLHEALASLPAHRKVLCDVLGRIRGAESTATLTSLLGDADANVRIAAAEALGRLVPLDDGGATARALSKALSDVLAGSPGAERALLGSALLDAMGRRAVAVPIVLLPKLVAEPVLGEAALRALACGAAPRDAGEAAAALAIAEALLAAPVRSVRENAIRAVAALAADLAVPRSLSPAAHAAATEALLEGTVEVQRAAAILLGVSGTLAGARALLVAASDATLAETAERALVGIARRDPVALVALAAEFAPAARAASYRAIGAAGTGHGEALVAALLAAARCEDDDVALAAVDALAALPDASAAVGLADLIDELAPNSQDRVEAARRALEAMAAKLPEAVLAVARAREAVPFVLLLGKLGAAADAPRLVAGLREEDPAARAAAAAALAELFARKDVAVSDEMQRTASDAARVALVDEAAIVRAAAARAVAFVEIRRPDAIHDMVRGLTGAARDDDARVRGVAVRALGELLHRGEASAERAILHGLRMLADGADPLTAVPALETVAAQLDPLDDARLLDALTSIEPERRKVALHALAARPHVLLRGDLARVVERALHDARWDLRRAATAALHALGDVGRPALLARRQIETDALVRADLDRALGSDGRLA